MRAGPVLVLLVGLAMPACAADAPAAPAGIFFPTVPIGEAYPAALMEGVLEVEDGCVYVANGGERWLALWPEGYTATRSEGRLDVRDGDGTPVAREGMHVTLGGGEVNPVEVGGSAASTRYATEQTGQVVPDRCGDLFWLVSPG
jgi:hypothetical protein